MAGSSDGDRTGTGKDADRTGSEPDDGDRTDAEGVDRTGDADRVARKWENLAKQKDRQIRQLEERLSQIEDQGKSELQRAIERAESAERAKSEAELRSLRVDVAARKGLPSQMAARLRGESEAELENDAEELASLLKEQGKAAGGGGDSERQAAGGPGRRDPDQGKGNGQSATPGGDLNDWMRRAAGRTPV